MNLRRTILALGLFVIGGCASHDVYLPPLATIHQSVLFDRHPNPQYADLGNVRSDWPSSDAYFADPENLTYRERIYDLQGNNFRNFGFPIRRFQLIREGSGVR